MTMAPRAWLLATLVAAAALLAGCTSEAPSAAPPAGPSSPADTPPAAPPRNDPPPAAGASPEPIADAGDIQGPFERSWDIVVPRGGLERLAINFALAPAQAGAPVTARVHLVLLDPEGLELAAADLGLGGDGDAAEWTLNGAQAALMGTYVLRATSTPVEALGLPSGGVAKYALSAVVEY